MVTAGLPGSGKGTFAEVAKALGIPVIVMGDIVREEAKKRNLELTSDNLAKVAAELRAKHGKDVLAKLVIDRIEREYKESCVVLVDGCRAPEELETFKRYTKVIVVAIEAPFELRAERLSSRARADDRGNVVEILKKRDEKEIELGVKKIMEMADFIIPNTRDVEDFVERAKLLLKGVLKEACDA
ncbi:Dephospho-CoA kinase-like protein [Ignicoccus hospitalis KIN4/I]|uniref:Dephospho-CoA kinase-like protein n=1 Tax=Ignicoccus hospitalis (strain KIN4/I / DSM 18386 / JCM 14125) TaxID=453591 RepID=A8AAJ6_IGNH4|nr:Dephospho-CoA kinase-like protein [Ignicoccus hospitalis KIN4/I]